MSLQAPEPTKGPYNPKSSLAVRLILTVAVVAAIILVFFLLGSGNDYTGETIPWFR